MRRKLDQDCILHPSLGVVVARATTAGSHLVLTSGNCIGIQRGGAAHNRIIIGDYVTLGANATIIGRSVLAAACRSEPAQSSSRMWAIMKMWAVSQHDRSIRANK
jgi:hypothetical protein